MDTVLLLLSALLILLSVLPFVPNQHWVFRAAEFIKLQLFLFQVVVFGLVWALIPPTWPVLLLQGVHLVVIGYHLYLLLRYTKFWKNTKHTPTKRASECVSLISCNVCQFNTQYERFTDFVLAEDPDILLTMESDEKWGRALETLKDKYPTFHDVPLNNTYGMHFLTRLKVHSVKTHFFVSSDIPSIEAELETPDGQRFVFFGVHPPPPSPTEEPTSKERDGDLLSVAKCVRDMKLPVVVTGDFNNVAWGKTSILFKKTSELIDARIGRGILATFHADYWFFRAPLDLLFHSADIFIKKLFIYPTVGSDHFPVGCRFYIDRISMKQVKDIKTLEQDEKEEVEELIQNGKEEHSPNRDSHRK